jgi:hypothetical protein
MARNGWEAKLRKAGCTQIVPTVGKPEDTREGKANDRGFAKFTATFGAQATCIKGGQRYSVSACLSDGIDGRIEASAFGKDMSDCLPGMKGKVEARILKKLYCLACDAIEADDEGQDNVIIIEEPTKQIEQPKAEDKPTAEPEPSETEKHEPSLARIRKILGDNPDQLTFVESVWNEIAAAKTLERLEEAGKELAAMKASVSQQVLSLVRPYYQARQVELKGGAA